MEMQRTEEKTMTGKTAKTIFWVGRFLSVIIFRLLTYDFHRQETKFEKTDQISVSHGHLAFFGACGLLNLVVFCFAMPQLKGIEKFDDRLGIWGFWIMVISMVFMGLVFGVAGVLQTYLERIRDIGYSTAHITMMFWFKTLLFFGVIFFGGVVLVVYHLFSLKKVKQEGNI